MCVPSADHCGLSSRGALSVNWRSCEPSALTTKILCTPFCPETTDETKAIFSTICKTDAASGATDRVDAVPVTTTFPTPTNDTSEFASLGATMYCPEQHDEEVVFLKAVEPFIFGRPLESRRKFANDRIAILKGPPDEASMVKVEELLLEQEDDLVQIAQKYEYYPTGLEKKNQVSVTRFDLRERLLIPGVMLNDAILDHYGGMLHSRDYVRHGDLFHRRSWIYSPYFSILMEETDTVQTERQRNLSDKVPGELG